MREEFWEMRRAALAKFEGKGLCQQEVADAIGWSVPTVRTYSKKFGFDFKHSTARLAEVKTCIETGMTAAQTAEAVGLGLVSVYSYAKKAGLQFVRSGTGPQNQSRAEAMEAMYRGGATLEAIGKIYGVSRERVRQILSKHQRITAQDGGKALSAKIAKAKREADRDARSLEKHGCTYAQLAELRAYARELKANGESEYRTPIRAFCSQRNGARLRGLEWNLKLWDWWMVWQKSGKWDERGRARDSYVMCRLGDAGAYEVGNVYIATLRHNSEVQPNNPYRSGHPDHDTAMANLKARRAVEQDRIAA